MLYNIGSIEFFEDKYIIINNELSGSILMQFTGLKDINGKEIYECDIITCKIYERENFDEYYSNIPLKVSWDDNSAGFFPFTKASQWRSSVEDIIIIGNIYENSELIIT